MAKEMSEALDLSPLKPGRYEVSIDERRRRLTDLGLLGAGPRPELFVYTPPSDSVLSATLGFKTIQDTHVVRVNADLTVGIVYEVAYPNSKSRTGYAAHEDPHRLEVQK